MHPIICTFRCDVRITESPVNDFLGLCIFGLENIDGILQVSELRVLKRENININIHISLQVGHSTEDSSELRILECLSAFNEDDRLC